MYMHKEVTLSTSLAEQYARQIAHTSQVQCTSSSSHIQLYLSFGTPKAHILGEIRNWLLHNLFS